VVSIDPCLVPIGVAVSLKAYRKSFLSVIKEYELWKEFDPNGSEIE